MLSEDEIDGSLDVALSVNLVSGLGKECILVTIKTNAVVSLLGVVGGECNRLRSRSVGVLNVDVIELRVGGQVDNSPSSFIISGAAC